jgi:hypothetical protein
MNGGLWERTKPVENASWPWNEPWSMTDIVFVFKPALLTGIRSVGTLQSPIVLLSQRLKLAHRNSPVPTHRSRALCGYEAVEGRQVGAAFDGGEVTSDAGVLLGRAAQRHAQSRETTAIIA